MFSFCELPRNAEGDKPSGMGCTLTQVFDARLHDLFVATIAELDGVGVSARFESET